MAAPGDEVVLPCRVEPAVDVVGLTVEWTKPDRPPDPDDELSQYRYVHLYRDTREVLDMKISSYEMRTMLFVDELRRGNVSLRITNVTLEDKGRYRCHLPKLQSQTRFSHLELFVGAFKCSDVCWFNFKLMLTDVLKPSVLSDPNFTERRTTETPPHPQTPDPEEELDSEGDADIQTSSYFENTHRKRDVMTCRKTRISGVKTQIKQCLRASVELNLWLPWVTSLHIFSFPQVKCSCGADWSFLSAS